MEETKGSNYKWLALLIVSIGNFMETIDFSIVNISFPILTKVFDTELSITLWVTVAYLLVSTGLMLIIGRLGDIFSRKKVYILGFACFTTGLILCSLSQSIVHLIVSRVVQGIGGAMIMTTGFAIVTAAFPERERGKALGIAGAMISAGLLTGPVLGGFLLDTLGWRSIFYTRVPVGIIGLVLSWILLREPGKSTAGAKFDIWGAATLFGGLCCLLLFINLGGRASFISLPALIPAGGAVLLLTLFGVQERRAEQPLVDLNLFRNRPFANGNIGLGMLVLALSAQILLMPFFLIDGIGYSATKTGLLLAAVSITSIVLGPLSGWLSDKVGTRLLCTVGLALTCLALFLLSGLDLASTEADIVLRLVIYGVGLGIFFSPNSSSIMGSVAKARLGTASAMMNTIRQIGMSGGMAIAGAIYSSRQSSYATQFAPENLSPEILQKLSLIGSYQDTILVAAIICGIGLLATLAFIRRQRV